MGVKSFKISGIEKHKVKINYMIFVSSKACHSLLEIGCSLSGNVRGTAVLGRGKKESFICQPYQTWLSFYPKSEAIIEYVAGQPIRAVAALIDPGLLRTLIGGNPDHIPDYLRDILDGSNESYCNLMGDMNSFIHTVINQIFNCPYNGFLRRIFLEARVFELLTSCHA